MFLNKNKHILSNTIMLFAVFQISNNILNALIRYIEGRKLGLTPALLDDIISKTQSILSIIQLLLTILVFYLAWKKISHYKKLISPDDMDDMRRLQQEVVPDKISVLSLDQIDILTKIWAAILIGSQLINEATTIAYTQMLKNLAFILDLSDPNIYLAYLSFYNNTHGFKYVGMLVAIVIGIFITGIFLNDKFFVITSAILLSLFLICMLSVGSSTLTLTVGEVGIVWTSVIFHTLETVGLLTMAIYLHIKYKGM